MKKYLYKFLCILLVCLGAFGRLSAQETNEATLKNILTNKSFIFKAQSAWPLQGTVIQLTGSYDLRVLQDSMVAYLPYFGRAYSANLTSEGGIMFTSKKFDYKLKERPKGGWEVDIKPSDTKDVTELIYSVSTNGYATLQVLSLNRQAISFYGVIEKTKSGK